MWFCFVAAAVVLLPLSVAIIQRRMQLISRAESAAAADDHDAAREYHARQLSLQTIVSWGISFVLAGQLAAALSATIPSNRWEWRAAYAALLLVLVVIWAYIVITCGAVCLKLSKPLLDSLSDVILSGAAYTVALAFLDATTAAFSMGDANESVNLGYVSLYAIVTLVVTAVALSLLSCLDRRYAEQAALNLKKQTRTSGQGDVIEAAVDTRSFLYTGMRKLLASTLSMCGVVAVYAFLYLVLASSASVGRSPGEPLQVVGAVIFFLVALLISVAGSVFIEIAMTTGAERLKNFDPLPDHEFDDRMMASLIMLLQTSAASMLQGLAWLVGATLHEITLAVWTDSTVDDSREAGLTEVLALFGYAVVLTFTTMFVTVKLAPPPMQGGSTPLTGKTSSRE
jgi:hypothetical protein